ncbi:chondroitinase-B domain-containing protein [Pedobacter aquatilis]|uniref:chondroitinase-B domain-containing protein n=1 Tax=Pedobacter aquatilis TaxID=351343 RepID=UPI00292CAFF3|nr:chondroitinase-B domain-containing protein [Pedobacter aquatilis]
MKQLLTILLCFMLLQPAYAKKYSVSSQAGFQELEDKLQPGDEVLILAGNYENWSVKLHVKGTAQNPVIIRGAGQGKTVFTGLVKACIFQLSGDYIILENLTFKNANLVKEQAGTGMLIELKGAKYCQVKHCSFIANQVSSQFLPLVSITRDGLYNVVSHCSFISNINSIDLQVKITNEDLPQYTHIRKNIFSDKQKVSWANGNGGECVQVGQDPILLGTKAAFCTVENNRFIRCNGENEVISNKSSGNKYLNNYFQDNDGELVLRGGHDCLIEGNVFKGGTGGIRINGTGHQVINNNLSGIETAIRLMYGMAKGKTDTGFYIAASGCIVKGNKISHATTGILEGGSKNADWTGKFDTKRYPSRVFQDVAPFDNVFSDNEFTGVKTAISHL